MTNVDIATQAKVSQLVFTKQAACYALMGLTSPVRGLAISRGNMPKEHEMTWEWVLNLLHKAAKSEETDDRNTLRYIVGANDKDLVEITYGLESIVLSITFFDLNMAALAVIRSEDWEVEYVNY